MKHHIRTWEKGRRKYFPYIMVFLIGLIFCLNPISAKGMDRPSTSRSRSALRANIQSLLYRPLLKQAGAAILVRDIQTGDVLFSLNPNTPMKPASNIKLFTSAAALGLLGPEYVFHTEVAYDGTFENGVLKGDLYLIGGGDPFLVPEYLWLLAEQVSLKGLKRVEGDLVADDSYFDAESLPDGDWKRIKMPLWYNAPTGALSFNFNAFAIFATPSRRSGKPVLCRLEPDIGYLSLTNTAKTGPRRTRNTLRLDIKENGIAGSVKLSGRMPAHLRTQRYYRHVNHPAAYCAAAFRSYLTECGVSIRGQTRFDRVPPETTELVIHDSRPLSTLLRDAMKFSNNFMMEQTLKTIAAEITGPPGSTKEGIRQVTEFLETTAGLDMNGFVMTDASGLSRRNRVTVRQITDLLMYVLRSSTFSPEYLNAMPVAGVDGTMRKRIKDHPHNRLIRAKTGLINGASCLSGIVDGRMGKGLVFSILINKNKNRHREAKQIQDDLMKYLLQYWIEN